MAAPMATRRDDARANLGDSRKSRVRDGYTSSRAGRPQLQAPGPIARSPRTTPKGVGRKQGRPGGPTNHMAAYEFGLFLNI